MIVWFLTGLWHGANYTFIAWGLMFFVLLSAEKLTGFDRLKGKVITVVKWCYTALFVLLGWVLFRSRSIREAIVYIKSMFGLNTNVFSDGIFLGWLAQNAILLVIGALLCTPLFKKIGQKTSQSVVIEYIKVMGLIILFILSVAKLISDSYNPFIYFNF